ncbi:MAG: hypothetical protein LBS37_07785 [Treponema sp.]|jgi:hypothetical protein|nr:hypothetical protein [Treponema sp.]
MTIGEKPAVISETDSFISVVDRACERLMDRQARYSLQKIHEMEEYLAGLERELDELLFQKEGKG